MVYDVSFYFLCLRCHAPTLLSWLSCHGCPISLVLSQLPCISIMFWLACLLCLVLPALSQTVFSVSCSACPAQAFRFSCPAPALFCQSFCPRCPVFVVMLSLFCPICFVYAPVPSPLSFPRNPSLTVLFHCPLKS
jgi:hypothetical protein